MNIQLYCYIINLLSNTIGYNNILDIFYMDVCRTLRRVLGMGHFEK